MYIGLLKESDKFLATPPHLMRTASCYKTHAAYDYVTQQNDIALIYLSEPVPTSWPLATIAATNAIVPSTVLVAGWGATSEPVSGGTYTFPTALMEVRMPQVTLVVFVDHFGQTKRTESNCLCCAPDCVCIECH
jgi:hypothetical protein